MAIENLQEVKEYFETNKDNEDIQNYLQGFKSYDLEGVKNFLEADEKGKGYLQSFTDNRVTKAINSYKENHYKSDLEKAVQEEMLKRNPKLTPDQLKLQELEKKFGDMEKAKTRAEMAAKYKDVLSEKKIPSKMIDFLLSSDDEKTNANISLFEESMKGYIEEAVKAKFDGNVHIPQSGSKSNTGTLISQTEWDKNKDDLKWYEANKSKIFESRKQGLLK